MSDRPHPKVARPDYEILDVIRRRWSPRAFDPATDIPVAALQSLFEAARWAPSSRNEQPWRFVVTHRSRTPAAFADLLASAAPKNQAWAAAAPVLVLVTVRSNHEAIDVANPHAWYDAGQAVGFLTLQATAEGLSVRQMQGFDATLARQVCAVPPSFEPAVIMAIGLAGDPDTLTVPAHREAELAPRSRRALTEFVFDGIWGNPWTSSSE